MKIHPVLRIIRALLTALATSTACRCTCPGETTETTVPTCKTDKDCMVGCQKATCQEGFCEDRYLGDRCNSTEPPQMVCDETLHCVKCLDHDGVRNDPEGGVDCGQYCDNRCADNTACTENEDCENKVCDPMKKLCLPATCHDSMQNGGESDIDCGGSCAGCDPGKNCEAGTDCRDGNCVTGACCAVPCDGVCRTCSTGACVFVPDGENPNSVCPGPTNGCDGAGHCTTCTDGHLSPDETDIDCGGPICPPCKYDPQKNKQCKAPIDCDTCNCPDAGFCAPPNCANGVKDSCETNIDCGGPWCGPTCGYGEACTIKADCLSGVCVAGKCGEP